MYNRIHTHTRVDVPRPHRRVEPTTIRPLVRSGSKVRRECAVRLEYNRRDLAFFAFLGSLLGNITPFFAVGRGSQVGRGPDFVLRGGDGIAEVDKKLPRRGKEMGPGAIEGNEKAQVE